MDAGRGRWISCVQRHRPESFVLCDCQKPSFSFLGGAVWGELQEARFVAISTCAPMTTFFFGCMFPFFLFFSLLGMHLVSDFTLLIPNSAILTSFPVLPRVDKPVPWLTPAPQSSLTPLVTVSQLELEGQGVPFTKVSKGDANLSCS